MIDTKPIIHLGDCEEIIPKYDIRPNLIFTSPPYSDLREYANIHPNRYVSWFLPKAKMFYKYLKNNGVFALNIDSKNLNKERHLYVYELVIALKKQMGFNFIGEYIWFKKDLSPLSYKSRGSHVFEYIYIFSKGLDITFNVDDVRRPYSPGTVSRYTRPVLGLGHRGSRKNSTNHKMIELNPKGALPIDVLYLTSTTQQEEHPAPMPEPLAEWFIKAYSNKGDLVLDPFCGGGTTLKMAMLNERESIGIDIKEEYVEMSNKRIMKNQNRITEFQDEDVNEILKWL